MGGCSIRKCKYKHVSGSPIRLFRFPKNLAVAEEWLRYCKPKTSTQNGRVCSEHFLSSDYSNSLRHILLKYSPKNARSLKPDAIPTQKLGDTDNVVASTNNNIEKPNASPVPEIIDGDHTYCNAEVVNIEVTPTIEIADSSEVVNKSTKYITIPLMEYKILQRTARKFHALKNNLDTIFTPGQTRCLMTTNKRRIKWSADDISAAISLKSVSPKGYRHLRTNVGIPLPAPSTLRKWNSRSRIEEALFKKPLPPTSSV